MLHQKMVASHVVLIHSGQVWKNEQTGVIVVIIGIEEGSVLVYEPQSRAEVKDFSFSVGDFLNNYRFISRHIQPSTAITIEQIEGALETSLHLCLECRASIEPTGHRCAGKAMKGMEVIEGQDCQCPFCRFREIYDADDLGGPDRVRRALASIK